MSGRLGKWWSKVAGYTWWAEQCERPSTFPNALMQKEKNYRPKKLWSKPRYCSSVTRASFKGPSLVHFSHTDVGSNHKRYDECISWWVVPVNWVRSQQHSDAFSHIGYEVVRKIESSAYLCRMKKEHLWLNQVYAQGMGKVYKGEQLCVFPKCLYGWTDSPRAETWHIGPNQSLLNDIR